MAMYWTTTHGRGPGFMGRAERRRRSALRAARVERAREIQAARDWDELAAALFHESPIVRFTPAPFRARVRAFLRHPWRSIVYYFQGGK